MSMEALTLPTPEKVGHSGNVRKLGHKGYSGKLPGIIQTFSVTFKANKKYKGTTAGILSHC